MNELNPGRRRRSCGLGLGHAAAPPRRGCRTSLRVAACGCHCARPAAECAAWGDFYVATGGPRWQPNAATRTDPCACVRVRCDRLPVGGRQSQLHITQLRLDVNNLRGTIPPSIGSFTQLTELYFFFNYLHGPLPPQIGRLSQLTELLGCCNQLNGTVPSSMYTLAALKQIDLSCNSFSGQLPRLPWDQYSSGCFIGGPQLANCPPDWNTSRNEFTCPLPAGIPAGCQASCKTDDDANADARLRSSWK